jgi:hypothetical protein
MVERRDDPGDRRIWRLHLLPPALPVLDEMLGERDEVARLLTAGLAPAMVEDVRRSLIAMKANVLCDLRSRPSEPGPASQPLPDPVAEAPAPPQPRSAARRRGEAAATAFQQDRV